MDAVLIFSGIIAILVVVFIIQNYLDNKRAKEMLDAAQALNLEFVRNDENDLHRQQFEKFPLFNKGRNKTMQNIMKGAAAGIDLMIFDYEYIVGSGKSSTVYKQTVASFQSKELRTPVFQLYPERLMSRIGHAFGSQDIDFDEFPIFSDQYQLKGKEEPVREFFNENILNFFTAMEGWHVEAREGHVLVMRYNKRAKPKDLERFFKDALEIYNVLASA